MVATGNDKYSFNAELAAKILARLLCICKSGIRAEMLQGASKIKVYLKLINTYIKNVNYCKTHENRLYKL